VAANPGPNEGIIALEIANGAVMLAYPDGPVSLLERLESQRRVPWVFGPETIVPVSQPLNVMGKFRVSLPE
jgi:hypothetical protein